MRAVFLMLVMTWMVVASQMVTTAQATPARANRVSVSYMPPKNPAHQPIYDQLKEVSFLEKLQRFLTPFRLPRALLVKVEGCDGDANANAFYEKNVITICYEYVEQLRNTMPAETTVAGVTPIDAIVGPLFDTACMNSAIPCSRSCGCRCWDAKKTPPIKYRPTSCCSSARSRGAG